MGTIRDVTGLNDATEFKEALIDTLTAVFDKELGTNLQTLYTPLAEQLATIDIETLATKHDNYISVEIENELVTRGINDGDRLAFEGAFVADRIRLVNTGTIQRDNAYLNEGDTTAILSHIPADSSAIRILETSANERIAATFVSFDSERNEVTFTSIQENNFYFIEYENKGNVLETTEIHDVPLAQFALGFGDNGFSFFGFGE